MLDGAATAAPQRGKPENVDDEEANFRGVLATARFVFRFLEILTILSGLGFLVAGMWIAGRDSVVLGLAVLAAAFAHIILFVAAGLVYRLIVLAVDAARHLRTISRELTTVRRSEEPRPSE